METSIVTDLKGLKELENEWDNLVKECKHSDIFMTFSWNFNWAKYILEKKLLCIIFREKGILVGIAPFYIDETNNIYLLGQPYSDYADIIVPNPNEEIFEKMFSVLNELSWKEIHLVQVPSISLALDSLKSYLNKKNIDFINPKSVPCPVLTFGDLPKKN